MWLKALKDAKQQCNIPLPLNPTSDVYHASIWKDNVYKYSLSDKKCNKMQIIPVLCMYALRVSMCSGTAFGGSLVHTSYHRWKQDWDMTRMQVQ